MEFSEEKVIAEDNQFKDFYSQILEEYGADFSIEQLERLIKTCV